MRVQEERATVEGLIDETRQEMIRLGYTELTRRIFERTWRQLQDYVGAHGFREFSLGLGQRFLSDIYQISIGLQRGTSSINDCRLQAIKVLLDIQSGKSIPIRRTERSYLFAQRFQNFFDAFFKHRRDAGISYRTLRTDTLYLERFSAYLDKRDVKGISNMDGALVVDFFRWCSARYTQATLHCMAITVKAFLRFAHDEGLTQGNLALVVPKVRCEKRAKVPPVYSQEEISRLLDAVDRGNPKGKRDYAILMIASRLGLRAGDICRLTFKNLRWDTSTIELQQQKNDTPMVFPMLNDVGEALIDYLKYGRPVCETDVVFLRLSAPIGPLRPPTLHSVVKLYLRKSGIDMLDGRKRGPHALRHSLASAMLQQQTPLPVIAGVLGHINTATTSNYLRIDLEQLRTQALEVPPMRAIWMGGRHA